MSEIKKNIETCRGEDVLAEVSALPQDPHFGSLVNEAFDPMQQQALHQAGYDGYSEVIAQHKPYTFASAIIQMKSNLLLLLRALWQFPFGSGTLRSLSDDASLRSLADMWQHYITRLSGNETYGIPSRLSSLTDLPSAPLLLADRKISGVPDAVDGISLANLICNNSNIHEINDSNIGWTFSGTLSKISSNFTALTKLVLGCETIDYSNNDGWSLGITGVIDLQLPYLKTMSNHYGWYNGYGFVGLNCETITLPEFLQFSNDHYGRVFANCDGLKYINLPKFQRMIFAYGHDLAYNCPELLEVYAPHLKEDVTGQWAGCINNCPKLQRLTVGNSSNIVISGSHPDLLEIRLGEEQTKSLNLSTWSPTLTNDNLATFLSNFRTYIALRLATFASNGPTLTLSQAVYDAIKDESHLFVFDEGTMTIYAYLTNIKHWTVTK